MPKLHRAALVGGGVELKSALVAGAAADTDIAVAGWSWKKDPRVIAILEIEATGTWNLAPADLQSEIQRGAATPDGSIQIATTVTTGEKLLILWAQRA